MPVQLACPGADAASWDDQSYDVIPGTVCVFDLPTASAGPLLAFPVLGWRWPLPDDWGTVDPGAYVSTLPPDPAPEPAPAPDPAPTPAPEPAPVDPAPVEPPAPVDPTPAPAPEPVSVEAPAPDATDAEDDGTGTVPEQLVALALQAGKDGVSTASAYAACGKPAYTALGRLASDGRLVKVGRGLYVHPDHVGA